jgi:phage-related protein (TIGR01555 family)
MKDLASIVGSEDENNIVKRAQIVDATRSIVRAIMIDKEEEFTRETTSLGGFPEMLQQFAIRLSAAARTPVSILMGQGNGGLNGPTSGANDTRWWYDATAAQQNTILRPRLNVLVRALFRAKNGPTKGVEPEKWRVHFPPLWQLSELEQADLRVKMSQADTAYVNAGILPPDTVARARFGGETYSIETHVDEDELTAFAEETAAEAEAQAANAAALERAAQAGAPPEAGAPKAGAPAEP